VKAPAQTVVKTTLLIPVDLWTRAKHLATDRRTSLREELLAALTAHLEKSERRSE
jgi:hypothetical protein